MKILLYLLFFLLGMSSCQSQTKEKTKTRIVGGPCEGCEAVFEFGDQKLKAIDTLPLFEENAPSLKVYGTVFKKDGKTPAENVILYFYQTNRQGLYVRDQNAEGWGQRHGRIRGWIKTDQDGQYAIYTFRPAAYPQGQEPEHIHITVKEPDKNEYYIDEYIFEDDPLLDKRKREELLNRGGSGIVQPVLENGIWLAKRDIVLGMNIPDYD